MQRLLQPNRRWSVGATQRRELETNHKHAAEPSQPRDDPEGLVASEPNPGADVAGVGMAHSLVVERAVRCDLRLVVERLPQLDPVKRRKNEEREPERIEHEAESSNDHNADVPRAEAL